MKINGVKIATTNSGIKYQGRDDLLLISFEERVNIAGVFTKSTMSSPSVKWCKNNLTNGTARALLVNAGNANTFTGEKGLEIIEKCAQATSNSLKCQESDFFMSSTGVIGEIFDYNLITNKIPELTSNLGELNCEQAAKAIMTTDLKPKFISKQCKIGEKTITISGIAKGSGMIQPNMATMLSYIFTDANIDSKTLQQLLNQANENSFNAITVDSDTSTSDTVLLFATKTAQNKKDEDLGDFFEKLQELMLELAKMIVIDGEGATKLIEIEVDGANNKDEAKKVAFSIANSPLVKTAISAADPNWGRIAMAIGKSEVKTSPDKITIKIGEYIITENGALHPKYNENIVHKYLQQKNIKIFINLGIKTLHPDNNFTVYTCDFTEEYIRINKDYRS